MAERQPRGWLSSIQHLSRRLTLHGRTTPPAQTNDLQDKELPSPVRSSSVPPTAPTHRREGEPVSVHHRPAGSNPTHHAFQTGIESSSSSYSSDASSSTSCRSSTSASGSHLHIGNRSPVAVSARFETGPYYPSEDDENSSFETRACDPLEATWKNLKAKRDEVRAIRADIMTLRGKAQRSRLRRDAADNIFMSFLRPLLTCSAGTNVLAMSDSRMRELFDRMQKTRDKCQYEETTIESLEERLDHAEAQLDSAEELLINELRPGADIKSNGKPPGPMRRQPSSPLPPLLLGIGAEKPEDFHPLYKKFMSAVGYLQLSEEHYQDLFLRKQSIERDQAQMKLARNYRPTSDNAIPRKLDTQDLKFLRDFDINVGENSLEMAGLHKDVERLRQMCQDRGVFPKHAPLHEAYRFEPDLGDDLILSLDPSEGKDVGPMFTSRFDVLMYSPNHLIEEPPITAKAALKRAMSVKDADPLYPFKTELFARAAKEYLIEHLIQDANESDKTDFINRWLLHRLRTSAVEVELLYTLFVSSSSLKILNLEQWQQDVLFYWTRDEQARLPPERYKGPITSEYTQGQPVFTESPANSSLQSDPRDEPTPAAASTP